MLEVWQKAILHQDCTPPKGPTHLLTDSPDWPSTFFLPTLPSYYSATRSVGAQLLSGGPPGVLTSCFAPFRCSSRMTQCLKIPQSLKHPISKSVDEKYCNKLWRNSVDHVWWMNTVREISNWSSLVHLCFLFKFLAVVPTECHMSSGQNNLFQVIGVFLLHHQHICNNSSSASSI